MTRVNVHAAQARLPELLDRVQHGEEIVIAREGKPVASLVALSPQRAKRTGFGSCKGQIDMSRFDEADNEIAREFGMID
jgi:prevent-host-death family protein